MFIYLILCFVYIYVHQTSIYLAVCRSHILSICQPILLPAHLSIHGSIYLSGASTSPFDRLSRFTSSVYRIPICFSVYLSVFPSTFRSDYCQSVSYLVPLISICLVWSAVWCIHVQHKISFSRKSYRILPCLVYLICLKSANPTQPKLVYWPAQWIFYSFYVYLSLSINVYLAISGAIFVAIYLSVAIFVAIHFLIYSI